METKEYTSLYKGILLGGLCAICGLFLALVQGYTQPIIDQHMEESIQASLENIFPDSTYQQLDGFDDPSGLIKEIYLAEGQGYIFELHTTGYDAGGIRFMIGISDEGNLKGFTVLEQKETSGVGSKAFEEEYVNQIDSLTIDDEVPLISGATYTTSGIREGIEAAKQMMKTLP